MIVLLTQYCAGGKIEKNYMGGVYAGLWWRNLRERGHLGDPDVDGRIILTLRLPD